MKVTVAAIILGVLMLAFVNLLDGPLTTTSSLSTSTDVIDEIPGFGRNGKTSEAAIEALLESLRQDESSDSRLPVRVNIVGIQSPHPNDCDPSTEVFVPGGGGNNVDLKKILSRLPGALSDLGSVDWGFCFERTQHHAGAVDARTAALVCEESGKSLPHVAHYDDACSNNLATALDNSNGDREWVGQLSASPEKTIDPLSCGVVKDSAPQSQYPFRCLR